MSRKDCKTIVVLLGNSQFYLNKARRIPTTFTAAMTNGEMGNSLRTFVSLAATNSINQGRQEARLYNDMVQGS